MKKFLFLFFFLSPFSVFSQNVDDESQKVDNQNIDAGGQYVTIREAKLYELSPPHNFIETIPKGYKVNLIKISGDIAVLIYNEKTGFTETKNLATGPVMLSKAKTVNYSNNYEELSQLVKYTKSHRLVLNAFYAFTAVSAVSTIPLFFNVNDVNRNRTKNVICGTVSGFFGLGALVSGICIYEFQSKINKTNVNLQLKANGMSVAF